MKKQIAIRDVALASGVSTATISRYLNGKFQSMGEDTRLRIEKVIESMGYKPNDVARTLRSTKSNTIAVILSDILNPYSIAILQGIEEACAGFGYTIFVCNSKESPAKESQFIEMMLAKRVDGFVINTTGGNDELIAKLADEIPVALVGRKISQGAVCSVSVDNFQGVNLAVDHMLQRGCDSLVLLSPATHHISPRIERVEAFRTLAARAAVNGIQSDIHIFEKIQIEAVAEVLEKIAGRRFSGVRLGIIATNGILSLAVLKAAKISGYIIPADFLFIGFDDTEWSSVTNPSLTVISQPTYQIGATAAKKLIAGLLNGHKKAEPECLELPVQLIARDSTLR
ncbi:LacI family DNA-binding transcriptional regulator [Acerihabitans arboris]|uniref:LacI family DNA-binding transcriptional regulator n=1 Tax=Acerihabitans arboris TaxID=2691583 RepID=A0A845S9D9_9GAMM|nr:LacI family DNA-binding transcriptional regulator [Acerihabitans arboris]NDL61340.1 LacI family DNA-binding transcriptional regulator [Acerihabitans arboris]